MGESYVAGVLIGQMRVNTYLWTFISCCSSGGWAEKLDGQSFPLPCQMELTGSPMPAVAGAWHQNPGNIVAQGSAWWHALWPQTWAESLHRQRAGTATQVQGDKIRQDSTTLTHPWSFVSSLCLWSVAALTTVGHCFWELGEATEGNYWGNYWVRFGKMVISVCLIYAEWAILCTSKGEASEVLQVFIRGLVKIQKYL